MLTISRIVDFDSPALFVDEIRSGAEDVEDV